MKNFSQLITEPAANKNSDTNEIIGILLAGTLLAYACSPIIDATANGMNAFFSTIFNKDGYKGWDWKKNNDKDNDKDKDVDKKKDNNKDKDNDKDNDKDDSEAKKNFNTLLMLSRMSNQKEKDKNTKQKNDALIKLLTACSFDKDGNELPLEERVNKMKDTMTDDQFESFKKDMQETYEKNKDDQNFKDALLKAKANVKSEDYDKMLDDAKKEAKSTLEQLAKEKKEIEDYDKKLDDLDEQINGGDEKDKEIRELKKQLEELKKNPPQTIASAVTGVSSSTKVDLEETDDNEKDQEEEDKEGDDKDDPKKEEGDDKDDEGKEEEVTDPETGQKIKAIVHTGPRGGKYYYPEGRPKTPEHRVYVESKNLSLTAYLLEHLS